MPRLSKSSEEGEETSMDEREHHHKEKRRSRSHSPRKTFSYLSANSLHSRRWKEDNRKLAHEEDQERIRLENRQILQRLAKISSEPSAYPTVNLEQERLRERHAADYRRNLAKNYIPILRENLSLVNRLAHVKGVYDRKKMDEDFHRHELFLKQDATNREKARRTAAERPTFVLPKIRAK